LSGTNPLIAKSSKLLIYDNVEQIILLWWKTSDSYEEC